MREEHEKAQALLVAVNTTEAKNSSLEPINSESGRVIYNSRCVICHGDKGKGDGKMKKVIKDPPPHNLTLSALPDELLMQIIVEGGEAIGRSMHMPPWKDELTKEELESVIVYIKTLRAY